MIMVISLFMTLEENHISTSDQKIFGMRAVMNEIQLGI